MTVLRDRLATWLARWVADDPHPTHSALDTEDGLT